MPTILLKDIIIAYTKCNPFLQTLSLNLFLIN